jgi:hypothetical protein
VQVPIATLLPLFDLANAQQPIKTFPVPVVIAAPDPFPIAMF